MVTEVMLLPIYAGGMMCKERQWALIGRGRMPPTACDDKPRLRSFGIFFHNLSICLRGCLFPLTSLLQALHY